MATRNVNLTGMLDGYVEDRVKSGAFQNASEVVRDALRLHKARTDDEARKEARLLTAIDEGLADMEAGRVEVIEDLDAWFDDLEAEIEATRSKPE